MKYKISFEVNIPETPDEDIITDAEVKNYFESELSICGIAEENILEFWSFENCTSKLKIEKVK